MTTEDKGIRDWAAAVGGVELVWERGAGDARCRGYLGAGGERAIETNGAPVFEDDADLEEFALAWDRQGI